MTAKEFYNTIKENKTLEEIMIEFARIKCLEAIRNTRYKCENIIEEWTDTENPNIKIALTKIEDLKDEELLPTF